MGWARVVTPWVPDWPTDVFKHMTRLLLTALWACESSIIEFLTWVSIKTIVREMGKCGKVGKS